MHDNLMNSRGNSRIQEHSFGGMANNNGIGMNLPPNIPQNTIQGGRVQNMNGPTDSRLSAHQEMIQASQLAQAARLDGQKQHFMQDAIERKIEKFSSRNQSRNSSRANSRFNSMNRDENDGE